MTLNEAFNIVRPLTQEEQNDLLKIAVDLADIKPPIIIQDAEYPRCLQCGSVLGISGNCSSGCGRVKERMR